MSLVLAKYLGACFTLTQARIRRLKADKVTDTEFADDLSLITDSIHQHEVQQLMTDVNNYGCYTQMVRVSRQPAAYNQC